MSEDVSDAELPLTNMDTGERICDVDNDPGLVYRPHSEFYSTDVT